MNDKPLLSLCFMHWADALIQSKSAFKVYGFYQRFICSLGIKSVTFALPTELQKQLYCGFCSANLKKVKKKFYITVIGK